MNTLTLIGILLIIIVGFIAFSVIIWWTCSYYKSHIEDLNKELEDCYKTAAQIPQLIAERDMYKSRSVTLDFTKDIEALLFLLNHKLETAKKYYLEPLQSSNAAIKISDENFTELYEEIITDTIKDLSPNYLEVLNKYFNKEALTDFITELIYTDLIKSCVKINYKNIKGKVTINNGNQFSNVNKQDIDN